MDTTGSDFLPQCRGDKSPKTFDEKLCLMLKRLDELIARPKVTGYMEIGTDSQKIGCEEALIEESSMSTDGDESQQFVEAGAVVDFQVSLISSNSELQRQYKVFSTDELNEKRDRGLCLCCDELWFIGHDCCKKKKFYVLDIDVDDALEVSECNVSETLVNVELVEKKVVDFDENLTGQGIQTGSVLMKELISENKNEGADLNGVQDHSHKVETVELQVFDELPTRDLLLNVTEKKLRILDDVIPWCLVVSTSLNVVCLDDVYRGEWMAIIITNHSSKGVGSLHKIHGVLEAQSWVVEWIELPLPPPEPPPRLF